MAEQRWAAAFPWLTETQRSSQLQRLLEIAEVSYRSSATQLRAMGREHEAKKMDIFALNARMDLEHPQLARWLHNATRAVRHAPSRDAVVERAMANALSLLAADRGNVQLIDPTTDELKIAVQCGFNREFLDYFAAVSDSGSACGRAATSGSQIVIDDVNADSRFAPHRDIAAASGFRAVQSTPLVNHAGRMVGVLSTHYPSPHHPSAASLQFMLRFAEQIADIMTGADKSCDGSAYQP